MIIELADAGYTPEQILLGIIQKSFVPALVRTGDGTQRCWLLQEEGVGIVLPEGEEVGAFSSTADCRAAIEGTIEDNHLATQPEAEAEAEDVSTDEPADGADGEDSGIPNGTYVGALSWPPDKYLRIVESRVEITISDGTSSMTLDYTAWENLEFSIVDNDAPKCAATARQVWAGTGSAGPPVTVILTQQTFTIFEVEGTCETPPQEHIADASEGGWELTLGYADGVISSDQFGFVISAERR